MRKQILIFCYILLVLAALLLLTAPVHWLLGRLFPSLQLNEGLNNQPGSSGDSPSADTRPFIGDLLGSYRLLSVRSPELELSSEELDLIQHLGIPLQMELSEDGCAAISIFDLTLNLSCDVDRMQFYYGSDFYPFFYQDGFLTLWDGETHLVFEKDPAGIPSS